MSDTIKILIADDHELIRNGIRQVLVNQDHFQLLEANNGKQAIEIIETEQPDLSLLDIEMPGCTGLEVAQHVHDHELSTDLIILTLHNDHSIFNRAMDLGVKGFVLKENTAREILECIQQVRNGGVYVSPAISDLLISRTKQKSAEKESDSALQSLTPTEIQVLRHLSDMNTSQEIADIMHISIHTVSNHRRNIYKKLDISGAQELLKFALQHSEQLQHLG